MKKLLALFQETKKNNEVCGVLRSMQFTDEDGTPTVRGIRNIDNETQGICVIDFKGE